MKYYGTVGYVVSEETSPGVWTELPIEKQYYGDVISYSRRWESTDNANDNINISNKISILADPFAFENLEFMRYITFHNSKWRISDAIVNYPRIEISIGGVYNG